MCTCGSLVTQGSGPNKKFAKKHAAAQMLDELKKVAFSVPPERTDYTSAMKSHVKKKKTRSIIKVFIIINKSMSLCFMCLKGMIDYHLPAFQIKLILVHSHTDFIYV